ncbi:Ubiquitin carboxyl-terminal hydrolase 25 [Babesia sp. Xinjiang]|uniref:Ubiquitin carboxyl-terminal hydrolase 25 n=1 Tax=Babesia sp. Xinjiang TaxID=462227 RepID=UPI000A24A4CE|nr:Ubiquitin carboxyl-terminal hydrolase 25 [Babesia sp. Xinjiang]ORM42229.1 Ubiquitin carboxyl-terminal hydrolase 25 [Babesia sp. Xinjiang]
MTDRWREPRNTWAPGERKSLFASTRTLNRHRTGTTHPVFRPQENQEAQPRLWSRIPSGGTEQGYPDLFRKESKSYIPYAKRVEPIPTVGVGGDISSKVYKNRKPLYEPTTESVENITIVPAVLQTFEARKGHITDENHRAAISDSLTVQLVDEPTPTQFFEKTEIIDSATRDTTADGDSSADRLASLKDLEGPLEETLAGVQTETAKEPAGIAADFIAKLGYNPFAIFRIKHARSPINVTEKELQYVKSVVLSNRHTAEELHSYFKASISVTNVHMMRTILEFLCNVIISDVSYRSLCVRMMETALVYHPDELVQCFSCAYIPVLFEPEVDDDVGGRFIRLLLSYKATFGAPGIPDDGVPVGVDSNGAFCYKIEECNLNDLSYVPTNSDASYPDPEFKTAGQNDATKRRPIHHIFTSSGKIETMVLLKLCANRARSKSAFTIPASRLRDWICTIWYELPATRPCLPLMRLCINWINSRDDPKFLKDAAFALLRKELTLMGEFEGGRLLMLELLSFMLKCNGDASTELSKIVDMLVENENNVLYAVMDSIISTNLEEVDMLDLWCLLCILPWPVSSPDSAICRLMSSTFLVFYQLAYDALKGEDVSRRFSSNPMGLLENALRICVCRCSSPVTSKGALLQTILLVELSPLPALGMSNAPLILSSLCPFLWKCHFVWSNCGRDVDEDSLLALRHLYDSLRTRVFCEPLSNARDEVGERKVPIFPRVRFESEDQKSDDISRFIGQTQQFGSPAQDVDDESLRGGVSTAPAPAPPVEYDSTAVLAQPRGLRNLGNTCYYNSVLQALFHTRSLVYGLFELYDSNEHVTVYQRIFRKLMKRGKRTFDPRAGYKLLPPSFTRGSEQQDVTETLGHIMESLDPSLGLWRRVFAGMVVRRVKCSTCGNLSDNREVVMDFTFPLNGLLSIQGMFDDYCQMETLCGGNRYFCNRCDGYSRAEMWNVIASPPAHLMVVLSRHLWRSDSDSQGYTSGASKLLDHVFVDDRLRICEFDYTLYGSIFHSGRDTSSGHYYFVGRDSEAPSRWHICDDSRVTEVTETAVNDISQNPKNSDVPYVVFYRCTQAPLTPALR